ncbi:solute carrier family 2, facilitated glucose transporter member 1-like [Penaeus japonicus]|uniref:solute carrier family 2, facilitated glucose transporter member 1-like n=1 Tax=Penaeus japonicus TaxID=27405 RepID=UPI001C70BB34|nr:solute carrier family 2, facilitated glucose transporter member 1-like [Penaeus japonicus]
MTEKQLLKQSDSSFVAPETKTSNQGGRVTIWVLIALFTAVVGSSIPAGYNLGVINTPHEIIRSWFRMTVYQQYGITLTASEEVSLWAVIVTLYVVGAIIGAPSGATVADRVGRRMALLINHLLLMATALVLVLCKGAGSVEMLFLGRFTSGLCSGLSTSLVPLYLSEVAPASWKGVMGVTFPMGMCIGVLLSQIMGMDNILGTVDHWNYLLAAYAILVAVALLLHPALPESPAYCFINARDEVRGRRELQRLHGKNDKYIEAEETALKVMAGMKNKAQEESSGWTFTQMIMNPKYRLSLLIAMIFNAGQQFSGINAVFFYSTLIFRSAGLNIQESQGASIGAGVINCIMALAAAPLIKYCRRRVLLMTSIVLCIVCQVGLMISLKLIGTYHSASFVAIGALMSYVLFYGMGLGPVPFMIATELFPSGPRSVGISIGSTSNWISNLVVGLTFPLLQVQFGEFSFAFFIASSILMFIFVFWFVPETLGREESPSPPSSLEFIIDSDNLETPSEDIIKNII